MADDSEFEDVVDMMMERNEFQDCLNYIETKIDANVVLDNSYLFETKLNCLYELDRKMDAFREAKAYHADYRPLTSTICIVLGNGYEKEGNYSEAYFYFSQFKFDDQSTTLTRLVKKIEKEAKMKLDKGEYEECLSLTEAMSQDILSSSEDLFDCKLICLNELGRKNEALNMAKTHLNSGAVLSHHGYEILGSSCVAKGNYKEAHQHFTNAMNCCGTREEKMRYRSILQDLEKKEEIRYQKRIAKIDPSFLKIKKDQESSKSTQKKVNQKKKKASQLQGAEDLKGNINKQEEVEAILFSATVRYSLVDVHNGIFDVIREDHFDTSPMSLVKATGKHLENLSLLKSWGYDLPYMARIDSALPSNSISSDPLLVVERVQPLHVYFNLEREEFMKNTCDSKERGWWEFIREKFRLIFRDIICGLFFLHSSQRVCSDFHDSFYVSKEGRGKIIHNFSKEFSHAEAQQDVRDLVIQIESIITGSNCQLIGRSKDWECYFENIKNLYNLPEELKHFLISLNVQNENIALCKLPSTWLIDHPFFWDDRHRITFVKVLKDIVREGLISETAFDIESLDKWLSSWDGQINNDLLLAIHDYKTESYGTKTSILFYMNAVYSHINDRRYTKYRVAKFKDGDIELLLRSTFPKIYTFFFEGLCLLSTKNPEHYVDILKRLSSCVVK